MRLFLSAQTDSPTAERNIGLPEARKSWQFPIANNAILLCSKYGD
jgi:hypothetical protein